MKVISLVGFVLAAGLYSIPAKSHDSVKDVKINSVEILTGGSFNGFTPILVGQDYRVYDASRSDRSGVPINGEFASLEEAKTKVADYCSRFNLEDQANTRVGGRQSAGMIRGTAIEDGQVIGFEVDCIGK